MAAFHLYVLVPRPGIVLADTQSHHQLCYQCFDKSKKICPAEANKLLLLFAET